MSDTHIVDPDRARLRQLFSEVPATEHSKAWSSLWSEGTFLPWDRLEPSPALVDLLPTLPIQPGQSALVPGCGRGYDVYHFAKHGVDATGLEIAPDAVTLARKWLDEQEKVPGKTGVVEGDFYKRDWEREGGYDWAYDYTFLCAMPPELRPSWGKRMAEIVKPGGHLICLEFPLYKALETGGPPWGLKEEVYVQLLGEKFERVKRFMPERTHKIGMGHDYISIWKRREDGKL